MAEIFVMIMMWYVLVRILQSTKGRVEHQLDLLKKSDPPNAENRVGLLYRAGWTTLL